MAEIVLIRHGETEWSAAHRHTSYTDLALNPAGERQARAVRDQLAGRRFAAVISSPRTRALRTAELAGLTVTTVDDNLAEWNYGDYEGRTTKEIQQERPGWNLWTDGCPDGESPEQVGGRLDRILNRATELLADGDVALVAHGHSLRVAGARWIGLPASGGGLLRLDTATVSALGYEHDRRVILRWNTGGAA
ncbi:histidine phosphatase family protein [Micromonospora sp. NBC_01796]|uniref:histidine phosphatase family protein n=1 Tax=Micromonospora sp. NBC_01796 TaxID=2975987 RepID=UPI002DD8257D|nr:histidine phosphatase family protein [Micromonospora sp. NBC_01796]WSA85102.1 histidine phosphatase family protein [Micromonospora sp. NBC_01796]